MHGQVLKYFLGLMIDVQWHQSYRGVCHSLVWSAGMVHPSEPSLSRDVHIIEAVQPSAIRTKPQPLWSPALIHGVNVCWPPEIKAKGLWYNKWSYKILIC